MGVLGARSPLFQKMGLRVAVWGREIPTHATRRPLGRHRNLLMKLHRGKMSIIGVPRASATKKNQIWLKTQNFLNVHRLKCQYKHLCPEVESSFGALQWPYGA